MNLSTRSFEVLIVGGGPGGIAPLLAAHRTGRLNSLLARGIAVVEKTTSLGSGSLGSYAINSDSTGRSFADCLQGDHDTELTRLADHPLTRTIADAGDATVPLEVAGRFLGLVGDAVCRMIDQHPRSAALTRHSVQSARRTIDGWHVRVLDLDTGEERTLQARNLVIATGAHQPHERLAREKIGGFDLIERCGDRLMQSGAVLTHDGLQKVAGLLAGEASPQVAIIGGSTSAAAVAHALLNRLPGIRFGLGGVTILHRRPLRVYYPDRASALADGYVEWSEQDVCQLSGRVYRLAGFRLDSRELVMQARGIGGRAAEPRLRLHQTGGDDQAAASIVDEAHVVVAALGYRPRALPVLDQDGTEISLFSHSGPQRPMVDDRCRVLDASGDAIENLFGIGLAAGFVPSGRLGGEASFSGQANGLWLWQHDVGSIIVDAIFESAAAQDAWPFDEALTEPEPKIKSAA